MNKDPGGTSDPAQENRDRDRTGTTGNAAMKGEQPSPGKSDGGDDDCSAIDLDSARHRAS
jgi:hypothetical protein